MNDYISKYLDSYLERENTDYAVLLTGKWGCGKTHFIKEYQDQKNEYKFIYISLFGLNSISEINDAIFRELHPILGHKATKYIGGVIASAVKMGFKIDLLGSKEEETTISIDFSKLNPLESKKYKGLVFIFDDLERTKISISEILGFINYLCEQSTGKVIVIANEEKLSKDENYNEFKEKSIGKTFEIKNNERDYWISFKNNNQGNILKTDEMLEIVKGVYKKFGDSNFRNLNRVIEDFVDFHKYIDEKFLKNKEFSFLLVKFFFSSSLEFRKKNDIEESLNVLKQDEELKNLNIFQPKTWANILLSKYIKDELNSEISRLVYFQDNSKPSWLNLWHYRTLSESEFNKNLIEVLSKFNNLEYDKLPILTHVVSLLILFNKGNISDLSIESIENKVDEYLSKYSDRTDWFEADYSSPFYNGTGYGYANEQDDDVKRIKQKIINSLENKKSTFRKESTKNYVTELLSTIANENYEEYYSKLGNYDYNPIFDKVDKNMLNQIIGSDNVKILYLLRILDSRYSVSRIINDKTHPQYFKDEKIILDLLKEILEEKNKSNDLSNFDKLNCKENINFLNKILQRF